MLHIRSSKDPFVFRIRGFIGKCSYRLTSTEVHFCYQLPHLTLSSCPELLSNRGRQLCQLHRHTVEAVTVVKLVNENEKESKTKDGVLGDTCICTKVTGSVAIQDYLRFTILQERLNLFKNCPETRSFSPSKKVFHAKPCRGVRSYNPDFTIFIQRLIDISAIIFSKSEVGLENRTLYCLSKKKSPAKRDAYPIHH